MAPPQFLPTNRNSDQSALENDTCTNLTTAVTALTLSGRDSVTDTIGVAKTSKVLVATPNYSKRPSLKVNSPHFSLV
jgi:hypothetical protein